MKKNKNDLLLQKWQELGEFWPKHWKVSKTCTLIGFLCLKYITLDLKKYRRVIFHDTEEWFKIWRSTDLWFGKWHEKLGKFSPEQLKVLKYGLWWDPLKIFRAICYDNEEWCKVWRGTDLLFQNWHEFGEFWPEQSKASKVCTLMGFFWPKYKMFDLKKYRGVIFHNTEE